jgi:CRP-like cAMP-binding protein
VGILWASDELRTHLIAVGDPLHLCRGNHLFRRGDPVTGVFLITSGAVRLGLEGDLPAFPWRTLGPGSLLGLPATLSDAIYSLTAEVVDDADLIFLPRQRLLDLLRQQHHLCFQIMNILTEELNQTRAALARVRKHGE